MLLSLDPGVVNVFREIFSKLASSELLDLNIGVFLFVDFIMFPTKDDL